VPKISGEIVAMALNATDWHRSQIKTFCYQGEDGFDLHVVRDLTKPIEDQTLWRERVPRDDHDACYQRKMLARERAEADVIADRINRLIGESS
jgi:hypothetical protein